MFGFIRAWLRPKLSKQELNEIKMVADATASGDMRPLEAWMEKHGRRTDIAGGIEKDLRAMLKEPENEDNPSLLLLAAYFEATAQK